MGMENKRLGKATKKKKGRELFGTYGAIDVMNAIT